VKLVLDTNVVLDWLVFEDPRINSLRRDIEARAAVILTHSLAHQELQRVLAYPTLKLGPAQQSRIFEHYVTFCESVVMPPGFTRDNLLLPKNFPRCRDRDDQFWFALSLHAKVDALISRDKKVVKLAKRAATFGIRVLTYEGYNAV
jgi:putative PIN family toxin of toxin-antitoxin system